eukprot:m51a1_g339 hypothetical protein (355) ;mRNA; f:522461-524356
MAAPAEETWVESCASTQDLARESISADTPGSPERYRLFVSSSQTKGRGTHGRPWLSQPGNVYMTAAVPLSPLPQPTALLLPLVVSVAVHGALALHVPAERRGELRVKWPNDVLAHQRKLVGVLIESHAGYALVGIGVNVSHAPEVADGGRPAGCLRELGSTSAAPEVARSPGNVYMTAAVPLSPLPQPTALLLPLVVSVAVHGALALHVPAERRGELRVKWPNDVLAHQRKLVGVLIESHAGYALVGIGVNVSHAPEVADGGRPAGCLRELGSTSAAPEVARSVFEQLRGAIARLTQRTAIISEWSRLVDWEQPVCTRSRPQEMLVATGISDFGELLVTRPDGTTDRLSCEYIW